MSYLYLNMSSDSLKRKRDAPDSTSEVINSESDRKRERVDVDESASNLTPNNSKPASDILKEALRKIIELQEEINAFDDAASSDHDEEETLYSQEYPAEALGFAMCAWETLTFLQREGFTQNDPIYRALRERLVGQCQGIPL